MLLALVFGVTLALVGVTAGALVAVASEHFRAATVVGVVDRDASLVEYFVNGNLRETDLDADRIGDERAAQLSGLLGVLTDRDESIARLEIRDLDGGVLVSDDRELVGTSAGIPAGMRGALDARSTAVLLQAGAQTEAAGELANRNGMVQEYLPIVSADRETLAVVAVWRDARTLMAGLDATQRDLIVVTMVAGVLLAGMLFLVFRASQARLTRQHHQLLDATRRDALTGMLNHGAVVALLAEEVEAARRDDAEIGVALVDVDNFRLFNDTHGHEAADQVLLRVAALVAREGAQGSVARYGPDEFLIVQRGQGTAAMGAAIDRLRVDLRDESVQFVGRVIHRQRGACRSYCPRRAR